MKPYKEIWKRLSLAPDYDVSSLGNVRRATVADTKDVRGQNRTYPGRPCKAHLDFCGYYRVWLKVNGKLKGFYVHRLVACEFIGSCPDGKQVNHKDSNKVHNWPSNLEYVTSKENTHHAIRNGHFHFVSGPPFPRGAKHPLAKLTIAKVRDIRNVYDGRRGQLSSLARKFGVTPQAVYSIVRRESWAHVA